MHKTKKRNRKKQRKTRFLKKVIHIDPNENWEKNELYTELSTLSTEKQVKFWDKSTKKTNIRFVNFL